MLRRKRRQPGETVFGLVMLALSLFIFYQAYRIAGFTALSSPGAFPLAAAAAMVVAAAAIVLRNARLLPAYVSDSGLVVAFFRHVLPPIVLIFLLIVALFAATLDGLGFLPSALAFLLIAVSVLHRQGMFSALFIALFTLAVVYVIFRLVFKVVLPEGIVPERAILAWLERWFSAP